LSKVIGNTLNSHYPQSQNGAFSSPTIGSSVYLYDEEIKFSFKANSGCTLQYTHYQLIINIVLSFTSPRISLPNAELNTARTNMVPEGWRRNHGCDCGCRCCVEFAEGGGMNRN